MNYLKNPSTQSSKHDEAMEMGRRLTPNSEMPRKSWGSLEVSVQTTRGLCATGRKCVRKDGHDGECWPKG